MTSRRDLLKSTVPFALAGSAMGSLFAAGASARQQQNAGPAAGKITDALSGAWSGTEYALPDLPYDYNALEPHIDEQTMRLHHDKHHQAYVDGLNSAMKSLEETAGNGDTDAARLYGLQRNLSFNYGGHLLHTLFWATMGPDAGGEPGGEIKKIIDQSFGGFDGFKKLFSDSAGTVKGSGWVILVWDPLADKAFVKTINEHDTHFGPGQVPLLPLDIWEHAFYLKYQNQKSAYVDAYFNVIDWQAVDELFKLFHNLIKGKATHDE